MSENVKLRLEGRRGCGRCSGAPTRSISPMGPSSVSSGTLAQTKAEMLETLQEICVETHEHFESYKQKSASMTELCS